MERNLRGSACAFLMGAVLASGGCGGGSSGEKIDLVKYMIPQSDAVITYNDFSIDSGDLFDEGTYDSSWMVYPGAAILNSGDGDIQIDYDGSRVYVYVEDDGSEYYFARNPIAGKVYTDSEGDKMAAFGPFEARVFSVGAGGPTYSAENVIVLVGRIDWGIDSDIYVEYHVEGQGAIGSHYFEFCPVNVKLDPDYDYAAVCDPLYFATIRIEG